MERDYIIKSVGFSYILLGVYYSLGITGIDKQTIASLSASAFLFILSDFCQTCSETHMPETKKYKTYRNSAYIFNTMAIFTMLTFPFLEFERYTEKFYDTLGTTTLLIGLGISICLIAKKNEIREEKYRNEINDILKESKSLNDEAQELAKEARDVVDLYKATVGK